VEWLTGTSSSYSKKKEKEVQPFRALGCQQCCVGDDRKSKVWGASGQVKHPFVEYQGLKCRRDHKPTVHGVQAVLVVPPS